MVNRDVELAEEILRLKRQENAIILAHNYQRGEIQDIANFVGDSLELSQNASKTDAKVIIVGTEVGIVHRLSKETPDKKFIAASKKAVCPNMKKITLGKMLWSLEDRAPEVRVTEEIRVRAKRAVDKMLEIGRVN